MGRPPKPVGTALGAAIRARRSGRQVDAAAELGVSRSTLAEAERGTHAPSLATARALARWLGWSLEDVLDAAERPADG